MTSPSHNETDTHLDNYIAAHAAQLRELRFRADVPTTVVPPRRRRGPVLALAVALAAVIVTAGALLGGGSTGKRLNVLSEARAALSPNGDILHLTVTTSVGEGNSVQSHTDEQWVADGPPRWRVVQVLPPTGSPESTGVVGDAKGPIEGRQEFSYADGKQNNYIAERHSLEVNEGFSDTGPAARVPSFFGLTGGADPAADLKTALANGDLVDDGEHQTNRRTVRRLISKPAPENSERVSRRFVYDVDPVTFVPVGGEVQMQIGPVTQDGGHPPITIRFYVDDYDRLPATPENEQLLKIATTPNTQITVNTAEQIRARERDRLKGCVRDGNHMRCAGP